MSQPFGPNVVRRLALIRFLYMQGLEQVRRAQPLAAAALLSFHDAVEMFLLLAAEHLKVNLPKGTTFDGYWTEIANSGTQLPSRPAMRRLNNSRMNFKHHGSIPSAMDLQQFEGDVTTFLTDATQMVFGADFHSLDMIDLVTQPNALTLLRNAETQVDQGDRIEALAVLSEAFNELLNDYADRKRAADRSSPYTLGPPGGFTRLMFGRDHDAELTRRVQQVEGILDQMQQAMRVLAMGLDYRRYAQFKLLVPNIAYYLDGGRKVYPVPGLQVGDDEYRFCRQFVIETALHLAEQDFDLDLHKIAMEHLRKQQAAVTVPAAPGP